MTVILSTTIAQGVEEAPTREANAVWLPDEPMMVITR
jgi:hypothetical protein